MDNGTTTGTDHDAKNEPRTITIVQTNFHHELHPRWRELRDTSRQWAIRQGLLTEPDARAHLDKLHYTDLAASCHIGAPPRTLAAIADFFVWFFVMDDHHHIARITQQHDRWHTLYTTMRSATLSPDRHRTHDDPVVAALADAVARLYTCLSPRWNARFVDHFLAVLDGYDQEYHKAVAGEKLSVTEYEHQRQLTFGHQVWIDLLELAADHELPVHLHTSDLYQRAATASQDFCAWCNDFYSLPKETADDDPNNYITILAHQNNLSIADAQTELHRRITNRVHDFLNAERELTTLHDTMEPTLRTATKSCVANMRNWISGTYWFQRASCRYHTTAPRQT